MAEPEQADGQLLVAIHEGAGLVRVQGRGTFKLGSALKKFGHVAVEAQCGRILLDMTDCVGMDSTFMGVLAGLASELRQQGEGELILFNLSSRTRGLLATLGLDQVVKACLAGSESAELKDLGNLAKDLDVLEAGTESREQTARTMLSAHESLVDVTAENYPRFKDVLTFLREDLEKQGDNEENKAPATDTGQG